MAVERDVAAARERRRRVQYGLAALLVIGVVVGVVLAATGGSGSAGGAGTPTTPGKTGAGRIPPAQEKDLAKAASAAGCRLKTFPSAGQGHVTSKVTYKTNPPTSGPHNPEPALDGIYGPGDEPAPEHLVHALEHGRVEIQYRPGTATKEIAQLETLVSEPLNGKDGYKTLLFRNDTRMPYDVAATAWTQMLGCPRFTPAVFDALRDFRAKYVDKGPELIPPTN